MAATTATSATSPATSAVRPGPGEASTPGCVIGPLVYAASAATGDSPVRRLRRPPALGDAAGPVRHLGSHVQPSSRPRARRARRGPRRRAWPCRRPVCCPPPARARPGPRGADQIDIGRLRADLSFIASDELEGRDTPSRGLDLAARYLAARLQALGLKPAGDDGSYFQRFGTTRRTVDPAKATVTLGDRTFSYGDDFLGTAPGHGRRAADLRRPRLRREEEGHRRLRRRRREGQDHRRPCRAIPRASPAPICAASPGPDTWESPASYAARHGALGVVLVPDYATLAGWRTSRDSGATARGALTVDAFQTGRPAPVPVITASMPLVSAIFSGESVSASDVAKWAQDHKAHAPVVLDEKKRLRLDLGARTEAVKTQNVVAIYEGGDADAQAGVHRARRPLRPHRRSRRPAPIASTTAPTTTARAPSPCSTWPRRWSAATSGRGGRGCSCGTPARRRGCGARATSSSTRRCRSTRSSCSSTST